MTILYRGTFSGMVRSVERQKDGGSSDQPRELHGYRDGRMEQYRPRPFGNLRRQRPLEGHDTYRKTFRQIHGFHSSSLRPNNNVDLFCLLDYAAFDYCLGQEPAERHARHSLLRDVCLDPEMTQTDYTAVPPPLA